MENRLRTDITVDKKTMTKEQAEAYDSFIDVLVDMYHDYTAKHSDSDDGENA